MLSSFATHSTATGSDTLTHSGGFGDGLRELPSMGSQGSRFGGDGNNSMFILFAVVVFIFFMLFNRGEERPTN